MYRRLLTTVPDAMVLVDEEGRIVLVNQAAEAMFGYAPGELPGQPVEVLVPESVRATHRDDVRAFLLNPHPRVLAAGRDLVGQRKDGEMFPLEVGLGYWHDGPRVVTVATLRDITARKQTEAHLHIMATQDSLTGLCNHRAFHERCEQLLALDARHKVGVALLLLDVDDFKAVNDRYGHAVGDELLSGIGAILRETRRKEDTAARLGGDEFAVLLAHTNDNGAVLVAEQLAERIRNASVSVNQERVRATVSIGATVTDHAAAARATVESLLVRADRALYVAKGRGGNGFHLENDERPVFHPDPRRRHARVAVSHDADVWVADRAGERRAPARVVVLSTGGACLVELDEPCAVGQVLSLCFTLPSVGEIRCRGIIRNIISERRVGVEFVDLPSEMHATLARFVRHCLTVQDTTPA